MSVTEQKSSTYTPKKKKQIQKYQRGLRTYREGFKHCMRYFLMIDNQIDVNTKQRWLDSLPDDVFEIVYEQLEGGSM